MPKHGDPFRRIPFSNIIALFGAYDLTDPNENNRNSLFPQSTQVHDDWNPDIKSNYANIAILTFQAGAITLSSYVQPIFLWNEKTVSTQTEGQVGCWGYSKFYKKLIHGTPAKLKVPIYTNDHCIATSKYSFSLANNRTFCAGQGGGICMGDGTLSIKIGSTFYFRGIYSSGFEE